MAFYENADADVVDIAPQDLGLDAIGHFGFFKQECKAGWEGLVEWLQSKK